MHGKIASQDQRDSLDGPPSRRLPQRRLWSFGPPKRLRHPPLDEAALPNHFLENELPKTHLKVRTEPVFLLQLLLD